MTSEDKKKVVGLDTVWVFKDYIDKVRGEIANNTDLSMKDYFDTRIKEVSDKIKDDFESQYDKLTELGEYVEQFGTPEEVKQIRLDLDALIANTNDKFDALDALNKELEILSGEYEDLKNSVFTEGQINELINAAMIDGVTITDDAVLAENVYASKLVAFIGNFAKISASQIEGGEITGHTIASSEFIPGTPDRRWQIGNEGEGWLANKQISWNANGDVTLGDKVTISYNNISGLQEEIGDLIDKAQNEGLTIRELIKAWSADDKLSPDEIKELLMLKDQILAEHDRVINSIEDIDNQLNDVELSFDSESDASDDTQQAIDAIKEKIANFRSLLNATEYTTVKDKAIKTIDYYKSQLDNSNTDSYNCVQIIDEYPLETINSYYLELNYLLENYDKVQNFLTELTGNIADLKINNINRILNNLEDDYNNLKEVTEETSELTQAIIDSFSNDNVVSHDEQLTLKLKLDEIVTEYASISTSVHALIDAYEEASTPNVDENGEEYEEVFIAEDAAEYLEKLTTAFEDYKTNYDNAYKILSYYTNEATERDDFGNIVIIPEYNLNDLPLFYDVRQKLLDIYYEANSYYTTYNRFGSKTTWIGDDGIYSGTIMADNLRGWCIEGLTVQSGIKSELPDDLTWYKYNGKETTSEDDAFTKITADYRDENGNPVTEGPTWQIYKDGTGHLANGNISWSENGTFNLGKNALRYDGTKLEISGDTVHINGDVKINGEAIVNGIEYAEDEDKLRISKIVAEYVTADQIFGERIAGLSVESDKTVQLPNELEWQKYDETENKFVTETGGTGPTWQIYNDGSGHLAKGNISWDVNGKLSANINGSFSGGSDGTVGNDAMTWDDDNIYFKKNIVFDDDCILTWGSNGGTSSGGENPGGGLTEERVTEITKNIISSETIVAENMITSQLNTSAVNEPETFQPIYEPADHVEIEGNYIRVRTFTDEDVVTISSDEVQNYFSPDAFKVTSDIDGTDGFITVQFRSSGNGLWYNTAAIDQSALSLGFIDTNGYANINIQLRLIGVGAIDTQYYTMNPTADFASQPILKIYNYDPVNDTYSLHSIKSIMGWVNTEAPVGFEGEENTFWTKTIKVEPMNRGIYQVKLDLPAMCIEGTNMNSNTNYQFRAWYSILDVNRGTGSFSVIGKNGVSLMSESCNIFMNDDKIELSAGNLRTNPDSPTLYGIKITPSGMYINNGGRSWQAWNPIGTSYDDTELTNAVDDLQTRMSTAEIKIDNLQDTISNWGSSD